jgi:long-chain acyl-CoA synthetase
MAEFGLPLARVDVEAFLSDAVDLEPESHRSPSLPEIADALTGLGMRPGEVVLVQMSNGTPLLRCFFGVLFAGGVPALLAPATPLARVRHIAEKLGARTLIAPARAAAYRDAPRRHLGAAGVIGLDAIRLAGIDPQCHEPGHVVILTSGTSGVSSGCLHRLSSLFCNARRHSVSVGLRSSDTVLVNLPLNFSYALVAQALATMDLGARLVITGPPFTPAAYTAALGEHHVTSSSLTPFMVRGLLNSGWKPSDSLRMLTVGGENLDPAMTELMLDRGPGLELYLTYGLTEAGPRVSTLAAHLEPPHRYPSVGQPLAGVQVALRRVDGGGVDGDGVGELLVTSDTVLRRRVGVEEGRAGSCFAGPQQIATGDLFSLDDDGYLYFRGRLSDFVVTGGSKVSLSSVRRIANSVPGVVTSATRSYLADDGETRFDLDLYLYDAAPEAAEAVRQSLLRQLMRIERPNRIRMLPAEETGHK